MSFHTTNSFMPNNCGSILYYENENDFQIEVCQDDIDFSNVDYFESDDEFEPMDKYMESTPMKPHTNTKFNFEEQDYDCDFQMEDCISFEFTERSDIEADKYINGVNVSQLSINASLSRFAATYPIQSKSHSLSVSSSPKILVIPRVISIKNDIPKPPNDFECCETGCVDCVWIKYADRLVEYFGRDDIDKAESELNTFINKLSDESLKAYLKLEFRLKYK